MIKHNGPISGVASSTKYVVTAGYDNQVIVWDPISKRSIARGLHDHLANRCVISKDQSRLLTASSDCTARLWQLPNMQLIHVFSGHSDDVETATFSPCGSYISTTTTDGRVNIFEVSGKLLHSVLGHKGFCSNAVWRKDSKLATCGDDGAVRVWNADTGKLDFEIVLDDVQTDALGLTSTGLIFAGNDRGEIFRIEGENKKIVSVHQSGIKNLVISTDESQLVTLSYDRTLCLLNSDLTLVKRFSVPSVVWARSCAFAGKDKLVLGTFGSTYASLDLRTGDWDLSGIESTSCLNAIVALNDKFYTVGDSGEVREDGRLIANTGSLCNFMCKFSDRLLTGGHMGTVYDAISGEPLLTIDSPINKAIQAGPYLALATYTGELILCAPKENKFQVVYKIKLLENAIKDLTVYSDHIFVGGAAGDIAIFNWRDFEIEGITKSAHAAIINGVASVGQGRFLTVGRDRVLKIWLGVKLLGEFQSPHDHSIKCAAATPDGRMVATCSYDGKMSIFDTEKQTWSENRRLTAAGISSTIFDNGSFWATSYDGHVYSVDYP